MASLFRFSIRTLLAIVTIACVGIAAMLNADAWLESLSWGAALLLLSCAILLAVYRREQQRAFWLGFVVFGGMYVALLLYSFTADWKGEAYASNPLHFNSLATTKVLGSFYERVIPESRRQEYFSAPVDGTEAPGTRGGSRIVLSSGSVMSPNPSYVQPGKFISIGHTLWLLVIAAVGGKVCQVIYRTRPQEVQT